MDIYKEHERIYFGVKNRQAAEAREAMTYHLSQAEKMLHSLQEDHENEVLRENE